MASHLQRQVGVDEAQLDTKSGMLSLKGKPGQAVELNKVLEAVKAFGFSPVTEIELRAVGQVVSHKGTPVFQIEGSQESFAFASKNLLKGLGENQKNEEPLRLKLAPKKGSWVVTGVEAAPKGNQP